MAEHNTPKPARIARACLTQNEAQGTRIARANRIDNLRRADVREAGRKGAAASPWSREPMNDRARHSARYQMIRAAAEGRAVQPMKLRRES